MSKSASEIEAEIEVTRQRMSERVREIGRRADLAKATALRRKNQIGVVAVALGVAVGAAVILSLGRRR